MTDIQQSLLDIRDALPQHVQLVAVSKFHPAAAIAQAYEVGQRVFGESRVQELQEKVDVLPQDIEWHFIGHLQQNKVKYIAPYVALIHAVDSYKLLLEINKQAAKCGRVISCLLQLHVAQEETKFGFSLDECRTMLETQDWTTLNHVRIAGLMCMATNTDDDEVVRSEFQTAKSFFAEVQTRFFADAPYFRICSWGMSDDFPLAIEEGSNMVRVGSKIFGQRHY